MTCLQQFDMYPQQFDIPSKVGHTLQKYEFQTTQHMQQEMHPQRKFIIHLLLLICSQIQDLFEHNDSFISFQIRYYNPKTRQFYYHNAHHPWLSTMSPIPPPPGGPINPSNKIVLAGEPETFSELSHPFYQMVRQV